MSNEISNTECCFMNGTHFVTDSSIKFTFDSIYLHLPSYFNTFILLRTFLHPSFKLFAYFTVLRTIFRHTNKVRRSWRKLQSQESHNFSSSPDIATCVPISPLGVSESELTSECISPLLWKVENFLTT